VRFQGAHDHTGAENRTNEYPVKPGDVISVARGDSMQHRFDHGVLSDAEDN
jgi:hypothetical protein